MSRFFSPYHPPSKTAEEIAADKRIAEVAAKAYAAGAREMRASFSGENDDGGVNSIKFFDASGKEVSEKAVWGEKTDWDRWEDVAQVVEGYLPDGWEINDGASGYALFDVKPSGFTKKKVHVSHNVRSSYDEDY
jgi:hypothetical protein